MSGDPRESPLWPADNPAVIAHISLLQGVINRMANNSASCKTWCITLVAALLSLAGATHTPGIITFSLVPVLIFGFMDAMYLAQEKAYRDLYKHIITQISNQSYSLTSVYDARASVSVKHFCSSLMSWSVFPVYLSLILAYLLFSLAGWFVVLTAAAK